MLNKLILILLVIALLGLTALPATAARREATPKEVEALFNRQASLSQKDIDIFIIHAPALLGAKDDASYEKAYKDAGFSNIRSIYVVTKVRLGYTMLSQPDFGEILYTQGDIPRALIPTAEEVELIKKNKRALSKFF